MWNKLPQVPDWDSGVSYCRNSGDIQPFNVMCLVIVYRIHNFFPQGLVSHNSENNLRQNSSDKCSLVFVLYHQDV